MNQTRTLRVNGQQFFHHFKKEEIDSSIDLLTVLASRKEEPKFYWKNEILEIGAFGSALFLNEIPLFEHPNDSPAHFVGGHAFFPTLPLKDRVWDSFPLCAFFLPRYEMIREKGKTFLITHAIHEPLPEEIRLEGDQFVESRFFFERQKDLPSSTEWDLLIDTILNKIDQKVVEKVVLARRTSYPSCVNPFALLAKNKAVKGTHFAISFIDQITFIGITPETLYRRKENTLFSEAVAGTRKRGKTEEEDKELEHELLTNLKEKREFYFVKGSIEEALRPLSTSLSWNETDQVLKTPNVQHLYNQIRAELKAGIDDQKLLSRLHPTAALGGTPQLSALEYLATHEPFERGWYASPIGYVAPNEAEFAVGIRSALVEKKAIHLFTGAGIVEGSNAEKEWQELENKMALWVK